ncbi:Pseudouridine synthase [Trema orientale]|uniref:Pseudouridine synthase n=1 Tax=Trema orientale TaxID=63057 RepID=A0A2P5CAL2_TREOI|nr:Pseudouridine synthase [Trema orientale]
MARTDLLRRLVLRSPQPHTAAARLHISAHLDWRSHYATATTSETCTQEHMPHEKNAAKWFTLPPYTATLNGTVLGKALAGRNRSGSRNDAVNARKETPKSSAAAASSATALKWVIRCCPELPRSLVQKLFRLRQVRFLVLPFPWLQANSYGFGSLQVRRESSSMEESGSGVPLPKSRLKRVAAKDSMNLGDRIFLPITVKELPVEKKELLCNEEEVNFIRSLELYKDPAIIVVNKPPGMPVQGGIGIKTSLDELAVTCLSYDCSEPPRLVHRLDRDCSGILVMGRTQTSATVLHSIFREKTFGATDDVSKCLTLAETVNGKRVLERRYWALVIGSPRRPKGLISAPLGKLVVDNGKSDRITVMNNSLSLSSQHAVTKYKVIGSSSHGYTWLELSPLTGRKHQLRVHCAEVLGTPIVGDYKYGWQAHRNWKPSRWSNVENQHEEVPKRKSLPFGLDMDNGSISDKHPRLHLHCKQMVLPNITQVLQNLQLYSDYDLSQLETLKLDAPLPSYMERSWDITNF